MDRSYFDQFDSVIVDETHLAHSTSFRHILENSLNADERFGFTGTLDSKTVNKLTLIGLFGNIIKNKKSFMKIMAVQNKDIS